ncbi:deoxynucleoside triphosphate triphosphohydrolase SAMHD1-like [Mercenaria mercenaria]|uniref:deoxynucleoside triphosphate triphosphohydrolase SAMHD1-like n=1 Tax=Mercenaria mercenaria TaxID=6596 RepID=UPI00234EF92E|nr:deoxynucleoside triphosphate triphosphohydrolase SAMHD1-like [Mercenaria mercenaria]XP_053400921.1 deoxynucleoside triphosphate triphosphohydrolase SAMHD1-like [Mercenaria mercenaria]XP_053400922.1 deoxynucleoside triphosphate triphosphohydrolase SAMHD1-like [Mercenaria mercenaria]XP_053400923.1 deoxynucleoside triphosphate triphosphohydrolase SAMHD1-like [Mercenaria mercenaria]
MATSSPGEDFIDFGGHPQEGTSADTDRQRSTSANNIFMNRKIFQDPIHGPIEIHPVCIRIIDTPQFQRLRHIKQLDTCYLVYPGASHNRFEHSLGVCYLAGKLLKTIREQQPDEPITDRDILCLEIAGLCHDLGQGPFSHVFEKRFMPKLGKPFKHEEMARKMLEFMLEDENEKLKGDIQTIIRNCNIPGFEQFEERDFTFIKEMIDVPKDIERGPWPYHGRDEDKSFMYEIVANKRNGVDVDKWDYLARDSYMLGIKINFDYNRCFATARVLKVNGINGSDETERAHGGNESSGTNQTRAPPQSSESDESTIQARQEIVARKQICYREKEAQGLYDMFYTRMTLHRQAYQHKTHSVIGMMICEALMAANESIRFEGKKISDTVDDMKAYTQLTDDIILLILYPSIGNVAFQTERFGNAQENSSSRSRLDDARKILNDIMNRRLYKFVSQTQVEKGKLKVDDFKEEFMQFVRREGEPVEESFIEYDIVDLDYGMEGKDPMEKVRFYRKDEINTPIKLKKYQVSYVLPATFAEHLVRIYCKVTGPDQDTRINKIEKAFNEWCNMKGLPPPKGSRRRQLEEQRGTR